VLRGPPPKQKNPWSTILRCQRKKKKQKKKTKRSARSLLLKPQALGHRTVLFPLGPKRRTLKILPGRMHPRRMPSNAIISLNNTNGRGGGGGGLVCVCVVFFFFFFCWFFFCWLGFFFFVFFVVFFFFFSVFFFFFFFFFFFLFLFLFFFFCFFSPFFFFYFGFFFFLLFVLLLCLLIAFVVCFLCVFFFFFFFFFFFSLGGRKREDDAYGIVLRGAYRNRKIVEESCLGGPSGSHFEWGLNACPGRDRRIFSWARATRESFRQMRSTVPLVRSLLSNLAHFVLHLECGGLRAGPRGRSDCGREDAAAFRRPQLLEPVERVCGLDLGERFRQPTASSSAPQVKIIVRAEDLRHRWRPARIGPFALATGISLTLARGLPAAGSTVGSGVVDHVALLASARPRPLRTAPSRLLRLSFKRHW